MAEEKTPTAVLAGRTLTLRSPTSGQLLLLHRAYRATLGAYDALEASENAQDDAELINRGMASAAGVLDVIERLIVGAADREWVIDQLLEGAIDLNDLLVIVRAVSVEEESAPKKTAARRAAAK